MKDTNPVITTLLKCQRCQWEWYPRQSVLPERCPHCKSRLWQTPRAIPKQYSRGL